MQTCIIFQLLTNCGKVAICVVYVTLGKVFIVSQRFGLLGFFASARAEANEGKTLPEDGVRAEDGV